MGILPISAVERLIRSIGAPRVSREAAIELAKILEQKGAAISAKAVKLANHAGRKTVTADDIRLSNE
ncbi:MAG: NFYB/HAP3 family transcription factor subunit [Candidatus Micrarchaeia archaeon]